MTAVVPFPLTRRRAFVLKQAAFYARQEPRAAESNLLRQLDVQRRALERRGVQPSTITAELAALATAIRAHAWRFSCGGVA